MSRAEVQEVVMSAFDVPRFSTSHFEQYSVKPPSPASLADSEACTIDAISVVAMLGFEKEITLKALSHS